MILLYHHKYIIFYYSSIYVFLKSPRIALQVMQTRRQQKQRKRQGLNSTITHQIDVPYFQFTTRPDQRQLTLSKISIQQCTTTLGMSDIL